MASSGTFTHRTTRDEIIKGALRDVSAYDPENSSGPTATQISTAAEMLNQMVKSWAAHGPFLWERKYAVIFPQDNQGIFVLGGPGPGGDHACLSTPVGSGFVATTLAQAAASGAGTVTVESTTSALNTTGIGVTTISDTYNIGVELDDGTVHWTTVSGALSGSVVTLAVATTGEASAGNRVFSYQTKLYRPLRIVDSFTSDLSADDPGDSRSPVRVISKDEYNRLNGHTSTADGPVYIYYDPRVNTGHVYIYPKFGGADNLLFIEFASHIEDFSTSTDDFDLPQEWALALRFNLALNLCPEYEVPEEKFRMIKELALSYFDLVKGFDQESPASVYFQRDTN